MIARSWQSRPRFEGTCQLCPRYHTYCGTAYLLLVGYDSTLRFCCDNFTRISGWTLDEIRGLSVIKTTVEDKQFEILLLNSTLAQRSSHLSHGRRDYWSWERRNGSASQGKRLVEVYRIPKIYRCDWISSAHQIPFREWRDVCECPSSVASIPFSLRP